MGKLKLLDNQIIIKEGLFKKVSLPLDSLRLLYLISPGAFKWYVVSSSSSKEFYNLDALPEEIFKKLLNELSGQIEKEKAYRLDGLKLCLVDYNNQSAVITFKDLKLSKIDLFEKLLSNRQERIRKLEEWMGNSPQVEIKGAVFNKEGFRKGKNKFIAWQDVGGIQSETVNFTTSVLILPKGSSGGMFNLKRYKYSIQRIPEKKKEIYMAECNFWHSLAAVDH